MDFKIDPEFKAFLPALSADEFALLRKAIVEREEVDPLVIAVIQGQRILLDGHHRYDICHGEGIRFPTRDIPFADRESALLWMVEQQFGRRNMTSQQRAYFIGKEYLLKKKAQGGDHKSEESKGQSDGLIGTAEKLSEKHKVSAKTVERDAEYAEALDAMPQEEKDKVLSGESKESKKAIIAKAPARKIQCRPCRTGRAGPQPNCKECKRLNEPTEKKLPKEPEKLKSGESLYEWKPWEDAFGKLYREIDKFGNAYKVKESVKAGELREKLKQFKAAYRQWFREVTGKKPPTE